MNLEHDAAPRTGTLGSGEDARWQAVLRRDPAADPAFFFAVTSTGIYCRPSCPARRPRREHVRFFASPASAENAGFRPCRRCRPREADAHAGIVLRVCRFIEAHCDETLDLDTLGAQAGLSPSYLQRVFKRAVGVTPREYADACRLPRFKARLQDGQSVTAALVEAGYGSTSRLYERAPGQMGMTPTDYCRGGSAQEIVYTTADCPLGRLLVAATARGLCAVSLGETDAALEAALAREYPAAGRRRDDGALRDWVAALLRHLQDAQPLPALPQDVRATAFQRRVWQELQAIPRGETRSYKQIAGAIGRPAAVRAVARACASNPLALIVPCHRVVRDDGALGGYRWGLARKGALLQRENGRTGG